VTMRRGSAWVLALVPLLAASSARAGDPIAAEALFADGKKLASDGRYPEACTKFEASERLDTGLGTQFHLADCWQHLGRSASAWALFREVESKARALDQTTRAQVAHDRAAALEPWVSRLVISPNSAAALPRLEIIRDGVKIPRDQWDMPIPVDPGTHSVTVVAPGKSPWQTTVTVPSDGKVVNVDVPPPADLPDESTEAVASTPGAPPASAPGAAAPSPGVTSWMAPSAPPETPVLVNRGNEQRAVGWLFVASGIAGLAAGGYFGGKYVEDTAIASLHCPGNVCDSTGTRASSDANTLAHQAILTTGLSGAALLTGIIVVASAPGPKIVMKRYAGNTLEIAPVGAPHGGGLSLLGSW
jgi:hypothetical protein